MRLFFTRLFVSERKQIAMIADEKSPARISHRNFTTKSLRNEVIMADFILLNEDFSDFPIGELPNDSYHKEIHQ